jgi:hypothetical protein
VFSVNIHVEATVDGLIGTSGSATHSRAVDHSMKAMDTMSSYGDHQQVIGGIYENIHSMEVRNKLGKWE